MKRRVIAVFLILLLLTVTFVTGVFAEPDSEDEVTEPGVTVEESEASVPFDTVSPVEDPAPIETTLDTVPTTEPDPAVGPGPSETTPETDAPEIPEETEVSEPTLVPEPADTEPAVPVETDAPEAQTEPETEPAPEDEDKGSENHLTLYVQANELLDQDLLFLIHGEGLTIQAVVPAGRTEVTLSGLPTGFYSVELDSDWNWQIELPDYEALQSISFSGTAESRALTFHPVLTHTSWLTDYAGGDGR